MTFLLHEQEAFMTNNLSPSQYIQEESFSGTKLLRIKHPSFEALISIKGAQLLSFIPTGKHDWFWLSQEAKFDADNSIRGGIPICFPWFGVDQDAPEKAKHGFVRNQDWQLESMQETDKYCELCFNFNYQASASSQALFSSSFQLKLSIRLSENIDIQLAWQHLGDKPQTYSFALHSYFAVNDLANLQVEGVKDKQYLDNTDALSEKVMQKEQSFHAEVDSVFQSLAGKQVLIDTLHSLAIEAEHADSCIIWNPGKELAHGIEDIGNAYRDFVCIERGAAFADAITLEKGQSYKSRMCIREVK